MQTRKAAGPSVKTAPNSKKQLQNLVELRSLGFQRTGSGDLKGLKKTEANGQPPERRGDLKRKVHRGAASSQTRSKA